MTALFRLLPALALAAAATASHAAHYKPDGTTHPCEGQAEFTILWRHQGVEWTITRAFSHGHGPNREARPFPRRRRSDPG